MNNKGQIIITDILLYLIILLVIFSIVIYATVTLNDNQVTRINNKQLNNLLEDSISALTKTSGTPNNWEELNVNKVDTVGLKSPKNQLLSYDKLIKLKNNPYLLDKYFPTGIDYSLTMYSKSNPNNEVLIAGKSNFNNKKQIQSKSTVVLFDYAFDITSFKKENMTVYCPYNHSEQWICKTINVNDESLSSGKYYIISDSDVKYIISNTYSENITGQTKKTCINNQLEQLMRNQNQTIFLHILTNNNNTYLVYDTDNKEEFLDEVIKPKVYVLNMKIAT